MGILPTMSRMGRHQCPNDSWIPCEKHTTAFGSLRRNQRPAVESREFITFLYCIMFLLDWWYSALASLGAYSRVGRQFEAAEMAGVSTVVLG
jgi:hypothetical protein